MFTPKLSGRRGSEWGLVFSVICLQFSVFVVKLANILMSTVFGKKYCLVFRKFFVKKNYSLLAL